MSRTSIRCGNRDVEQHVPVTRREFVLPFATVRRRLFATQAAPEPRARRRPPAAWNRKQDSGAAAAAGGRAVAIMPAGGRRGFCRRAVHAPVAVVGARVVQAQVEVAMGFSDAVVPRPLAAIATGDAARRRHGEVPRRRYHHVAMVRTLRGGVIRR